jgi:hypothetical protein
MRRIPILAAALTLLATPGFAQPPVAKPPSAATPPALPGPGQRGYIPEAAPEHDVLDQGILLLVAGRAASVTLGAGNAMTLSGEKAADASKVAMPTEHPDAYATTPVVGQPLGPIDPGKLTFTMLRNPSGGVVLILANGLDRPVSFAAVTSMMMDGKRRSALTAICTAGAGKRDFESWPPPIDVIQVIQVIDTPEGSCFDPVARAIYRDGDQPPSAKKP